MPASVVPKVTKSLVSAPLPTIIEKLGVAIAEAQTALDENSVAIAKSMAETEVSIGTDTYNLLTLGFKPTFYAFTDATVEAKLSFSMKEEKDFSLGVSVTAGGSFGPVLVAASVDVSYARKFSVESSGMSSIAARLVSLPPPQIFLDILERNYQSEILDPQGE